MPATDETYQAVLGALSDLSTQWRAYRDTVNRAINLLNHEVIDLAKRFDTDDQSRVKRQQLIDAKMEAIIIGQEQIKRWQAVRLGIEIAALLIIAAFVIGLNR